MQDASPLLGYAILLILVLVVAALFTRWVFSIQSQIENQKKTISLLAKIAEKLGVDREDIYNVTNPRK